MYSSREVLARWLFVSFILVPSAFALGVSPQSQQLDAPKDEVYTFVYSIVNSDPQPRTLQLKLDPFSTYLDEQVALSKEEFALLPGQTENIQLSITPNNLGPQTHTLKIGIFDNGVLVEDFELLIVVPGVPVEDYKVQLSAGDTHSDRSVPITVELNNYGNVIGYARLSMEIRTKDELIGIVAYPDLIQVLPNDKVTYDLSYNDQLEPGFYSVRLTAQFASMNTSAEDQFSVQLEESTQRLNAGEDLVLTFASLGNPSQITYSLTDKNGKEVAAGSFAQHSGDAIVPMSTLAAGTYTLALQMPSGERKVTVIVRDEGRQLRLLLLVLVVVISLYGAYSLRQRVRLTVRLFLLERAIQRREDEVTNLINRSHRLVDEYTNYARSGQASGSSRKADEGS